MPLTEHGYCVAISFKLTGWVEQRICIDFALSLNIPLQKLFGWFRRPQLWSAGDWQLYQDNVPTCASRLVQNFLEKYQITHVTQPPCSTDLVPCNIWLFQKLKSPLKGKRFQTISAIQENMTGQLTAIGRTVWGPTVPTLKGTVRHHCPSIMFLVCCIFSINVSIFHITWLGTFWTHHTHTHTHTLYIYTHTHTHTNIHEHLKHF